MCACLIVRGFYNLKCGSSFKSLFLDIIILSFLYLRTSICIIMHPTSSLGMPRNVSRKKKLRFNCMNCQHKIVKSGRKDSPLFIDWKGFLRIFLVTLFLARSESQILHFLCSAVHAIPSILVSFSLLLFLHQFLGIPCCIGGEN